MNKVTLKLLNFLLVLFLGLIINGCGGSSDDSESTSTDNATYTWQIDSWSNCSCEEGINYGTQTRNVSCIDSNLHPVDESLCTLSKPNITQSCSTTQCPTSETIVHNGISYKTVTSPYTGKRWLDRNLGASQACTSQSDTLCYGDYYQWGRNSDGHEKSNSTITSTQASNLFHVPNSFITSNREHYGDWIRDIDNDGSIRIANWSKTDGSSICPLNFRVPTSDELSIETIKVASNNQVRNIEDAFTNFLKIPASERRYSYTGGMITPGKGYLWSTSGNDYSSIYLSLELNSGFVLLADRADGVPVRCIEDKSNQGTPVTDTTKPIFTSSNKVSVNENQTTALTLVATDDNQITYSISGNDASSFNINVLTGLVTFKVMPDYETKSSYSFTAKATDSSANETSQEISITILDVFEIVGSIVHNGVAYNTVTSSITNKIWLDRDLGASNPCSNSWDTTCYGDYYQWGRLTDGHQKADSTQTTALASSTSNTSASFIVSSTTYRYDWMGNADLDGKIREKLWSKTDGTSICPTGYRVPSYEELSAEATTANFYTRLKFSLAGVRAASGGLVHSQGNYGYHWSSTPIGYYALLFNITSINNTAGGGRGIGGSVRCIKD